jgi:hypothetical protein
MGIPNITTNLSGFGCFMEDLLETPDVSYLNQLRAPRN